MKIDKNKLLDNFKNIKNIANFNILKCFHVLFCLEGISENVGFYILLLIILFHTIALFVFYLKGLNLLINKIRDIIYALINLRLKKEIKEDIKNKEIFELESKDKIIKEFDNFKNKLNLMNNNIKDDDFNNVNKKKGKIILRKKKLK